MKTKKVPKRMCVVTRESFDKKELIRVVRTPEGSIIIDKTGKSNGRGAYLKGAAEVIEKARKTKVLNKVFGCDVVDSIYDELLEIINL